MPSGAKKRKAAKKKKEKEAINSFINNPQGNDDPKSRDEEGSDGGEVVSPAHGDDHNHRHRFNGGNEELEDRDPSGNHLFVAVEKSIEEAPFNVGNIPEVEAENDVKRELKHGEDSGSRDFSIQQVESIEGSHDGDSNSSSSISDDESRVSEKKPKEDATNEVTDAFTCNNFAKPVDSSPTTVCLTTEKEPVGKTADSIAESSLCVSTDKPVVFPEEVKTHVTESAPVEKSLSLGANNALAARFDLTLKISEERVLPSPDKNDVATVTCLESEPEEHEGRLLSLSGSSDKKSSIGVEQVKDFESPECSENQPLVTQTPRVVQKTSCFGCCGLFEVLTSSSR